MPGRISQVKSTRLEALLDKLVAVQMDLEPVCGAGTDRPPIPESFEIIVGACDIVYSAIADLRNIIHQVDSATDPTAAGLPVVECAAVA
jgi:hypothetical protein